MKPSQKQNKTDWPLPGGPASVCLF